MPRIEQGNPMPIPEPRGPAQSTPSISHRIAQDRTGVTHHVVRLLPVSNKDPTE